MEKPDNTKMLVIEAELLSSPMDILELSNSQEENNSEKSTFSC
ncbi:hypothetical protein [Dendronalium sp. ChiSLP03b]|nr:hypothetical protein [Dendronalium sp. ChiSLP03b]